MGSKSKSRSSNSTENFSQVDNSLHSYESNFSTTDASSALDNSYRDNSSTVFTDSSQHSVQENFALDKSDNSVTDASSSLDNSYRDNSSTSLTDNTSSSTSRTLDASSRIDSSYKDSSVTDIADNSNNSRTLDASSQIDSSYKSKTSLSDSRTDNSSRSYKGDTDNSSYNYRGDTHTTIDAGSVKALENIANSTIAKTTDLAKHTTDVIAANAVDTLDKTNNAFLYASDLINEAQTSAYGEALLSSRSAFGDALGFADAKSKSDGQTLAEGMKHTLLLMALIAGGSMVVMRIKK